MTCIVGVEYEGDVWIGGDSAGVGGWTVTLRADEKVFRCGEYLYGIAGSFRCGNVLRYGFAPPEVPESVEPLVFLNTYWIDALRAALGEAGAKKSKEGVEHAGNDFSFLLGFRRRLYYVDPDFQVGVSRAGYFATGSGEPAALGALHVASRLPALSGEDRVRFALEAAEAHNIGVRGPFTIDHLGATP